MSQRPSNAAVATVRLPYALTWDRTKDVPTSKPGRGDAGWTVGVFESVNAARAFMAAHPDAAMPCWQRPDLFAKHEAHA